MLVCILVSSHFLVIGTRLILSSIYAPNTNRMAFPLFIYSKHKDKDIYTIKSSVLSLSKRYLQINYL